MKPEIPDGFILSDSAMYSFVCQDVYPDIISFAAAIPDHLKPLFLIPIKLEKVTTASEISQRVARTRFADGIQPTGDTPEAELFGTKTFVNDDNEPTVPSSAPGSIFRIDDAMGKTHHQECHEDQNVQVPTDTSYNTDVDMSEYFEYPYRTEEKPVRHSSKRLARPIIVKLPLKPEVLEPRAPEKVRDKARTCSVSLVSYDKKTRVFTFSVDCGNVPRTVQASLSDIDDVAMICDCPFWQWNGPEHNAQVNSYLLGQPYGTAGPPDVRDPNREYAMCKHAYAVLRKLDSFVQEIVSENWDKSEEELLEEVDEEWDRLEGVAEVPLDEQEDEEIEVDWEGEIEEEEEAEEEAIEQEARDEMLKGEAEAEPEEPELPESPAEPTPAPEEEPEPSVDYSGEGEDPEEEPTDYSGEDEEPELEEEEEPTDYSGDEDEEETEDKK
jgi:hypothetical protein